MNRDMKEGRVSRIQSCASRLNNTINWETRPTPASTPPCSCSLKFQDYIFIYLFMGIISRASTIKEKEKA